MAVKYIVTQLESPRHIVTRGFGNFVPLVDLGQGEIIELGDANFSSSLENIAATTLQKNFIAQVLLKPAESIAMMASYKELVAEVIVEPSVLVER